MYRRFIAALSLWCIVNARCIASDYAHDVLHRMEKVTYASGHFITYTYDSNGNRLTRVVTSPYSAPSITTQPIAQIATVGNSASFTSAATGSPAVEYQWRKDGVAVPGATNSGYTIPVVASTHGGTYDVLITNAVGQRASNTVALTVNKATQAITFPALLAKAFGDPPFGLTASASSGLTVTIGLLSGPASLSGSTLTLTGDGTVFLRASQGGNTEYLPAPNVDRSFAVSLNFASWSQSKFTAAELADVFKSGPNAVFGIDGHSNLFKYAVDLDPQQNVVLGLPEVSVRAPDWAYTYTRPTDRTDVAYSVEASTNLIAWSSSGVAHEFVSSTNGVETWRARYPLASAANIAFRLKVSRSTDIAYSPPAGGMTIIVPSGATRSVSIPLIHSVAGSGAMIARIGSTGTDYLDVPSAGWTPGGLTAAANPYYARVRSGAGAGRVMMVATTANTGSRVYLGTDGTDLTQAGYAAGATGDAFELVLADTLASLFSGNVLGGTSVVDADLVYVWGGASWLVFYFNTTRARWERSTDNAAAPSRDNFVLRPDRGIMITRRDATELRLRVTGRVPEMAPRYVHARPGTTFLSAGVPTDVTLSALALHTQPGWQPASSPAAAASSADMISVWGGAAWLHFYYDSAFDYWRRDTDVAASPSRNSFVVPAGRPLMVRRLTSGDAILRFAIPYTLVP